MMRWIGITTTMVIVFLVALFSWRAIQDAVTPADVRFVISSWPTSQLARSAETQDFFAKQGISVDIVDVGERYEKSVEAVTSGRVDGGIFVLSEPILLSAAGIPMRVVLGVDYSAGAEGIVVSDDIQSLEDLKGKKVAYQPGSFGDFLLGEALKGAGLNVNDIQAVPRNVEKAARSFLLGEVDAVVAVEPYLSQAANRRASHILFTSRETPGLLPDVIAFRESFVEDNRDVVVAFLKTWFDMLSYLEKGGKERSKVMAIAAISSGITLDELEREFEGIRLLGFDDNAIAFTYGNEITSLYGSGQRFIKFFQGQKIIQEGAVDIEQVIDPSFIRRGLR